MQEQRKKKVIIAACISVSLILAAIITFSYLHYHGGEVQVPAPAPAPAQMPLSVVDDFGREISLEGVPARIVSLSPANTEILFAIGAGDRVVGVTEYSNYPPDAELRPKVGGVATISIEKVIALKPDIAFGCGLNGKETVSRLEELGIPVVCMNARNVSGILRDIRLAGRITGEEENASRLVAEIKSHLDAIRAEAEAEVERRGGKPWVFYDIGGFFTAGNETFVNEIIEIAGGRNIAADKTGYFQMSTEELIKKNPQVIICDSGMGSMSQAYEEIMGDKRLEIVDAVRNNRVYIIDGDIIDRAGPRVVEAAETVYGFLTK